MHGARILGELSSSHQPLARGTVLSVVPVTAKFQAENALHPAARALLLEVFDQGWADPKKLHVESRRAALLLQEAKESLAADLGIQADEVHFLGESALGFELGINGLLAPLGRLLYSTIDREEVLAIASQIPHSVAMPVSRTGQIELPTINPNDTLVWQAINSETGLVRPTPEDLLHGTCKVFVDHTAYPVNPTPLPSWSTALWDCDTWSGPSGLSIFALRRGEQSWRNPSPRLKETIVPGGFSLPLALVSAIALTHWKNDREAHSKRVLEMGKQIRTYILSDIPDVDFIDESSPAMPEFLSMSFLYVDAERLQADLASEGFSVDSGSACSSANLEASHVLLAMGLLSQGNIRLRLHHDLTDEQISKFLPTLKRLVEKQRT